MSKATFGENLQKCPDHKGETTYVMYHGTTMKAARKIKCKGFIRSADGMLGPGVYVSRSFEKAACYPMGAKGQKRAVVKLSVRVGRVKKIDRQGHHLQKSWHQAGYDTAWVPPQLWHGEKWASGELCLGSKENQSALHPKQHERESSDDESTDEDGDDDDDDDDVPDTNSGEFTDEEEIAAEGVSGEESTDSSAERSSRHSSDTSTDEYVNTDDASQDHADDRSSDHRDDDEASDEEGSRCDERTYDFTETNASESSDGEFSNEYCYESDDDY